jgi:hypothetical protein
MGWSMLIDGDSSGLSQPRIVRRIATAHRSAYRNRASFGVSQPRFVRRIATALRSYLVRSKGQPSATMVGIDGALGKSSPFQVHRSFAMLASRCSFRDLSPTRVIALRIVGGLWAMRCGVFGDRGVRWLVRSGRFERKAPGESRQTF